MMEQGHWETRAVEFYNQLKGAPRSRGTKYFAIRSFFRKSVPGGKAQLGEPDCEISHRRVKPPGKPTLEEVRILCDMAPLRTRALILWEAHTGCRPETTAGIRYRDIDMSKGYPWAIYPKASKSNDTGYLTFVDEEAGKTMLVYWGALGRTMNPESPIFLHENSEIGLDADNIVNALGRIVRRGKKCGLIRQTVRGYGLRKLFQTQLEAAHVSPNWVKRLMCHSTGDVETAYSQAENDQMREAYQTAMATGCLRVYPTKSESYSEQDQKKMREILDAIKTNVPGLFTQIKQTETLQTGKPDLLRDTLRAMA